MHTMITMLQDATAGIGWDKILAGGTAAGLVTIILIYVLRHLEARDVRTEAANAQRDSNATAQHVKCNSTIETVTSKFAETIDTVAARSDDRLTQVIRETRDAHERREEKLYELLRAITGKG